MGCSPSKIDGLPAVSLCRDRCNSLEETLRRSSALADAHAAYLLSLNTVGPALHRFFDQAVESPTDAESEAVESPDTSSSESSSSPHSLSSSDSDSPPKFDSDCEEDGNKGTDCDLFRCPKLDPNHDPLYSRNYESGTGTPPPSNYAWILSISSRATRIVVRTNGSSMGLLLNELELDMWVWHFMLVGEFLSEKKKKLVGEFFKRGILVREEEEVSCRSVLLGRVIFGCNQF